MFTLIHENLPPTETIREELTAGLGLIQADNQFVKMQIEIRVFPGKPAVVAELHLLTMFGNPHRKADQ